MIPSMDDYTHNKVYDEIANLFPNFNAAAIEVWDSISNSFLHILMDVITYPCLE